MTWTAPRYRCAVSVTVTTLLLFALAGCASFGSASEKPVEGAELWLDAALNGRDDDVRARTCEEGRDQMWIFPLAGFLFDPSGGYLALAEALMPADAFTFRELSNQDGIAVVEVNSPNLFVLESTQFHFFLKKEGREWHWCGGEEP